MAVSFKVELKGHEKLNEALVKMANDAGQPVQYLLPALKKTAPYVMAELAKAAPRSEGSVAAYRRRHGKWPLFATMGWNQNTKAMRYSQTSANRAVAIRIGPRYPEGAQAHLTEFGTKDRWAFLRDAKKNKVLVRMEVRPNEGTQKRLGRRRSATLKVYVYQRDPRKFRGRASAEHWLEHTWQRIIGTTEQMLQMNVRIELQLLAKKHGLEMTAA